MWTAVYAVLLIAYCIYDALGLVAHSFMLTTPLVILAFAAMIAVLWKRPLIEEAIESAKKWIKPLLCVAIVAIGLFVCERSYVSSLAMTLPYALLNLVILGVLFCIVYFLAQQARGAAIFFLVACFIFGVANYFVITFKGQPVMPADFYALGTAAAVSQGYVYEITDSVVASYVMLAFGILLASFLPQTKIDKKRVVSNTSAALACVLAFGVWFSVTDIERDYESYFYMFRPQLSYADYGSVLCFLSLVQQLDPPVPEGYSEAHASEILETFEEDQVGIISQVDDDATVEAAADSPSVLIIMNETFADLSIFSSISETYSGPAYYQSIDDAVLKGEAYVSVLGAGTCNSEFEALTGASMANLGSGYPYMNYDLSSAENLVTQMNSLGYDTTAIHPDKRTNWKRDVVYDDFGFDEFYDIESFEDAETLRGFVRDKETYQLALDILEENDTPQFIFDVTIQNHGGYSKGDIPEDVQVNALVDDIEHPNLDEYLSTINQSDKDLEYLIESLREMDEPVIVCFFGDHQPSIMNWLYEYLGYENLEDAEIEELQSFYRVPYMIWANYEIDEETAASLVEQQLALEQGISGSESVAQYADALGAEDDSSADADTLEETISADEVEANGFTEGSVEEYLLTDEAGAEEGIDSVTQDETEPLVLESQGFSMSLNYLGAYVVKVADLPLSDYQNFLLALHAQMPAINANGFMDASGAWYSLDDEEALSEERSLYGVVQYYRLFD